MAKENVRPQTGNRLVAIALQMAGKPGQRKMSGILDYLAEKDLRWEIRFVRHREDFSLDFVRALSANPVDGILYSFDTVPTVEAELAKIDIPTVGLDVFDQSPLCGRTRNLALVTGDCAATELLCGMMEGHVTTKVRRESCGIRQVAVRESTPKISNAGRLVQRAVAYIQSHATKGIGVRDVVAHLKCSRRLADLRFRELQGMSILEAIRKVQMDEVCRLLRTTNLSVAAIAAQTGFTSAKHLPERFKAAFGCSMGAYRT